MNRVILNAAEVALAYQIAANRTAVNRASRIVDARRDTKTAADPERLDITGALGEVAFAKLRNVFPDVTVSPRRGTPDFVIDGMSFDIKATDRPNGRLLATLEKNGQKIDYYVLAIVTGTAVDFVGCATESMLINPANLTDLGHGQTYALEQSQLLPLFKNENERNTA